MKDNKSRPSLAIAILNYNGINYLKKFMPFLIELDEDPFTLIIVDNASTDNSLRFLSENYPRIKTIELDENYGYAGGYNAGLKKIESDYYFLLNSDIKTNKMDVERLYEYMIAHRECGALQPKVRAVTRPEEFEYAGAAGGYMDYLAYPCCRGRIFDTVEKDEGQYDSAEQIFWASGAAMMVKAEYFHALGGFEEYFFAHHEEIDLCWRMQRAGLNIRVLPSAVVYHKGGGTLTYENPFKTFLNFRNNLLTLIRNNPVSRLLWLFPLRLILDGIAAAMYFFQGKFTLIGSILRAHYAIFFNFGKRWKERKEANNKIQDFKNEHKLPVKLSGKLRKSLIFQYYILGKKTFSKIMS